MSLLSIFLMDEPNQIEPIRRLPHIRDLVTDVSWYYEINQLIRPLKPKPMETDGIYRMQQKYIERILEFHKCIECLLCQNVCLVMQDQQVKKFAGPSFLIRIASLAMHPLDTLNRLKKLKDVLGIGNCNITKCCTEFCPEDFTITDNAIISLKERVTRASFTIHWPDCVEAGLLCQNSHAEASTKFHEKVRMK